MAIQILGKFDFNTKIVTREKGKYFIMIKKSIYQKKHDGYTYTVYDLQQNPKVHQPKLTEFKGDVENSTITV